MLRGKRSAAALVLGGLMVSAGGAVAQGPGPGPVLAEDFEAGGGAVAKRLLRDARLTIEHGQGVGGGSALRTRYVGSSRGSDVIAAEIPLGESGTDYTLNYDVKFAPDFQFVLGGKMHGLGPAQSVTGGQASTPEGWSVRVMWREEGRPVTYTYHQDRAGEWGDDGKPARPFAFSLGRYHAVSLHVRLNDPVERANGLARLYVDGALVSSQEGLRLRASAGPAGLVRQFMFSTFHGGHDPSWAPRDAKGAYKDVFAWFDNVAVYRGEHIRARPGE
ncbi:MAG: hypothetical protein J7500_13120 [Sphingomonas sp.]|uniref:polysaccharide lyase n=1 Tax=Sphingomonas sp. TaxID=28214 RepID=UPI001B135280|nr:hypothetical protein [Sphingomonas sp.]MBO9623642.1 hypothetical protein [Sphingomonas sp.]